jgi:hypothetical protein
MPKQTMTHWTCCLAVTLIVLFACMLVSSPDASTLGSARQTEYSEQLIRSQPANYACRQRHLAA